MHRIAGFLYRGALMLSLLSMTGAASARPRPLLLAHYMPWFQAPPASPAWGWHWTMNHFHPDVPEKDGLQIASHYFPLTGPYDSLDPTALKYEILLMKMSGIDGVIFDWYGTDNYLDYARVNQCVQRMIPLLQQAKMGFAVCYEDQTVPREIAAGLFPASDAVTHGQELMRWMQQNFFSSPAYIKWHGAPLLLSFGNPYYSDAQWQQIFTALPKKPAYLTELDRREPVASSGGFDWPIPAEGTGKALQLQQDFLKRAASWPLFLAAAYPRFHDIYEQAGVGKSWGRIQDDNGNTYTSTLARALQSSAFAVQIVTWNDWGEGTQVEPSTQYGYRDLLTTRKLAVQYLHTALPYSETDMKLPLKWVLLCKKQAAHPEVLTALKQFFPLALQHKMKQASALLDRYDK